jgi:predicted enzyme related to lactoylglutathione lyase
MARVLGVGGVFFKSEAPEKLGAWYRRWLNVPVDEHNVTAFNPDAMPAGGVTVWSPFDKGTSYFAPSTREYMFNLIVDDLDGALRQVAEGGAELVGGIQAYDYGRFGWFIDPDGNKVELWQPASG